MLDLNLATFILSLFCSKLFEFSPGSLRHLVTKWKKVGLHRALSSKITPCYCSGANNTQIISSISTTPTARIINITSASDEILTEKSVTLLPSALHLSKHQTNIGYGGESCRHSLSSSTSASLSPRDSKLQRRPAQNRNRIAPTAPRRQLVTPISDQQSSLRRPTSGPLSSSSPRISTTIPVQSGNVSKRLPVGVAYPSTGSCRGRAGVGCSEKRSAPPTVLASSNATS
ncbi:unnamed protein product [Protopolystoma xenopodis]|uniref:Uncharacterized protein n=1 Tax=Protopolystoma xenopodis TaxID=117903 RepID=A0A448WNY6_9PLAT|nr:unnamed protein product [Protopolystoma xenopodis]